MININNNNLVKYVIMFVVVTISTRVIPTCGVLKQHALYVGMIAASTFALIDTCYPNYVVVDGNENNHIH